jgi:hypothetical protein
MARKLALTGDEDGNLSSDEPEDDEGKLSLNRRQYVVAGTAAVSVGSSVGFSSSAATSGTVETYTTDFSGYSNPVIDSTNSSIITSFEDGDLSEYDAVNSSEIQDYRVISESTARFNAIEGTQMLRVGPGADPIHTTSGLDNYPSKGTTSELYVRFAGDGAETRIGFGGGDFDNSYHIQCNPNDLTRLRKRVNGSQTPLDSNYGFGWQTNTWYRIEIQWADGNGSNQIDVRVYDTTDSSLVGAVAARDDEPSLQDNAGIAFSKAPTSTSNSYIDNWRLIS